MNPSAELVSRLWRLCAVLRKDGITYPQYVAELTYLLFLKMMKETDSEDGRVPAGSRWQDLIGSSGDRLAVYRKILRRLGSRGAGVDPSISRIFSGAATVLRDTKNLQLLIDAIDRIEWFSDGRDSFGDLYEGLLQKNAEETKRGAGQYFTPRVVINVVVKLMRPQVSDVVQDPAAGTGGFLIAAHRRAMQLRRKGQRSGPAVTGMENVQDTYRLLLMNLYLHGIDSTNVHLGDALSEDSAQLLRPSLILTNPPFGPAGGRSSRLDLAITANVANYQLPFVEHCMRALAPGGRAAIVVPDSVLFEEGRARTLREHLLQENNLHTILRLPTGIFYAQGVKTNILFFERPAHSAVSTEETWIYDLRTNMPAFGKTNALSEARFKEFVSAYGEDANGRSKRKDTGSDGRFRRFTRADITARDHNLDITWLRDEQQQQDVNDDPDELAAAIVGHLRAALAELESIADEVELDAVTDLAEAPSP